MTEQTLPDPDPTLPKINHLLENISVYESTSYLLRVLSDICLNLVSSQIHPKIQQQTWQLLHPLLQKSVAHIFQFRLASQNPTAGEYDQLDAQSYFLHTLVSMILPALTDTLSHDSCPSLSSLYRFLVEASLSFCIAESRCALQNRTPSPSSFTTLLPLSQNFLKTLLDYPVADVYSTFCIDITNQSTLVCSFVSNVMLLLSLHHQLASLLNQLTPTRNALYALTDTFPSNIHSPSPSTPPSTPPPSLLQDLSSTDSPSPIHTPFESEFLLFPSHSSSAHHSSSQLQHNSALMVSSLFPISEIHNTNLSDTIPCRAILFSSISPTCVPSSDDVQFSSTSSPSTPSFTVKLSLHTIHPAFVFHTRIYNALQRISSSHPADLPLFDTLSHSEHALLTQLHSLLQSFPPDILSSTHTPVAFSLRGVSKPASEVATLQDYLNLPSVSAFTPLPRLPTSSLHHHLHTLSEAFLNLIHHMNLPPSINQPNTSATSSTTQHSHPQPHSTPQSIELQRLAHHMRMLSRTLSAHSHSSCLNDQPIQKEETSQSHNQTSEPSKINISLEKSPPYSSSEDDPQQCEKEDKPDTSSPAHTSPSHPPPPNNTGPLSLAQALLPLVHSFITYASNLRTTPWPGETSGRRLNDQTETGLPDEFYTHFIPSLFNLCVSELLFLLPLPQLSHESIRVLVFTLDLFKILRSDTHKRISPATPLSVIMWPANLLRLYRIFTTQSGQTQSPQTGDELQRQAYLPTFCAEVLHQFHRPTDRWTSTLDVSKDSSEYVGVSVVNDLLKEFVHQLKQEIKERAAAECEGSRESEECAQEVEYALRHYREVDDSLSRSELRPVLNERLEILFNQELFLPSDESLNPFPLLPHTPTPPRILAASTPPEAEETSHHVHSTRLPALQLTPPSPPPTLAPSTTLTPTTTSSPSTTTPASSTSSSTLSPPPIPLVLLPHPIPNPDYKPYLFLLHSFLLHNSLSFRSIY